MKYTQLRIDSTNDDWTGQWNKDDVESEMSDIDVKPEKDTDWMTWVLGMDLDSKDYTGALNAAIINPQVESAVIILEGVKVNIKKS